MHVWIVIRIVLRLSARVSHGISIPVRITILIILSLRWHAWLRRHTVPITLMLHSGSVIVPHGWHDGWRLVILRIHWRVPCSHIWLGLHVRLRDWIHNHGCCACDNQLVSGILPIIIFLLRSDIIIHCVGLHQDDLSLGMS